MVIEQFYELPYLAEIEIVAEQYVFWWLGRRPTPLDCKKVAGFLFYNNIILIKENGNSVNFRKFNEDGTSIHITFNTKEWGFSINAHLDIIAHKEAEFTKECLINLSKIYLFLKKCRGQAFILPRQNRDFRSFRSMWMRKKRYYRY